MYDFMIMVGGQTAQNYPDINKVVNEIAGTKCRVIEPDTVWAVRTNDTLRDIHSLISSKIGDKGVFVIVPMSGPWDGQNCSTAKKCFG
jgi:hypothetical protein